MIPSNSDLTNDRLALIKDKLCKGCLSKEDLKGLQFFWMVEAIESDEGICDIFSGLKDIVLGNDNILFVLCDVSEDTPTYNFFSDYTVFAKSFEEKYMFIDTEWKCLSDEELLSWIDRLEYEFSGIPFCEYNADDIEDVEYD